MALLNDIADAEVETTELVRMLKIIAEEHEGDAGNGAALRRRGFARSAIAQFQRGK